MRSKIADATRQWIWRIFSMVTAQCDVEDVEVPVAARCEKMEPLYHSGAVKKNIGCKLITKSSNF